MQINRALISVSNKQGVTEFASGLADLGVEIVSTGGTARQLDAAGIAVRSVSDLTGFPEIMGGRVKTLHPKLHAGLLAVRDDPDHLEAVREHGVELIDLVCVNLYPFEQTVARPDVTEAEAVENIDIGGPTMIRAAAKNFSSVAVVVSPERYEEVLALLRSGSRRLPPEFRRRLAAEAYAHTAAYDTAIARWFAQTGGSTPHSENGGPAGLPESGFSFPDEFSRTYSKQLDLSYGENPHQRAAYYTDTGAQTDLLDGIKQLGGKPLSYNNLLDLHAALLLLTEHDDPSCVIVKHNNPCGYAVAAEPLKAYRKAFACDPVSAFGGVIAFNRPIDRPLAEALSAQFIEVLCAPKFEPDALELLSQKQNLRLLERPVAPLPGPCEPEVRYVTGGLLIQDRDLDGQAESDGVTFQVATDRQPTEAEWGDLMFAWAVCKHVRSNAIVLAKDGATVGIGAGQMSRVDSVRLAVEKAGVAGEQSGERGSLQGASLASDAFFPFADGPQLAIEAGVTAVIQPGGSVRDSEVIEAANAAGIAMVLTGRRHFRH